MAAGGPLGVPELVGPFPEGADPETYDRLRRRALWRMPAGIYLLGSAFGARRNLMTHNWAMQVATKPKLLAISVRKDAVTHDLVSKGRAFSLCFLRREDRALARTFTKPALDEEEGALSGVAVRVGSTGVPVLARAAAWLECEVRQEVDAGDHTLFVGEVVDCSVPDDSTPVLRVEDTRLNYGG
jgi:flavin reductase (DIM6/NTAB) family NADH-FMN oxidoreductase RutF